MAARLAEFLGAYVQVAERIDCHHDCTARERHVGREVWLSRTGAIAADAGRPGLVPGSMGTAGSVVVGEGDVMSLSSSPHGAGREDSRSAARRTFPHEQLREAVKGIERTSTG